MKTSQWSRNGGELTDDGGLRVIWTDDVGLAEAVSGLEVLALGLVVRRDRWDRTAGVVRVVAHYCNRSCYSPGDERSGFLGVVQVMGELAQTREHIVPEGQIPQTLISPVSPVEVPPKLVPQWFFRLPPLRRSPLLR